MPPRKEAITNARSCSKCGKTNIAITATTMCRTCADHKRAALILFYPHWHTPQRIQWAMRVQRNFKPPHGGKQRSATECITHSMP